MARRVGQRFDGTEDRLLVAGLLMRGGVFPSGESHFWSSLRCGSVDSGSSKSISQMIHATSGMRSDFLMIAPMRLCALEGRFATRSTMANGSPTRPPRRARTRA